MQKSYFTVEYIDYSQIRNFLMKYRLTKIYTRQGDEGFTTLNDKKISKDDLLLEVLGTLDELNSHLGMVVVCANDESIKQALMHIQHELFNFGGELYLPERVMITAELVAQLEKQLDEWNKTLPPLKDFLLPGGNQASAAAHIARTVCRRAERTLVRLHRQVPLNNLEMLKYLNRLSDVLFVTARMLAKVDNAEEVVWEY